MMEPGAGRAQPFPMSDTRYTAATGATEPPAVVREARQTGWVAPIIFGAVMLMLVGAFQAMLGLVALLNSGQYQVTRRGLVVPADYTVWGWVHLVLGLLAVVAGFGVIGGRMWARVIGIIFAVLSIILNIAFMPAYPVWSVIVIVADVVVIYALAVHGREMREDFD